MEQDLQLFTNYEVKLFRMVPENAKLVCQNRITGKVIVKNKGFHFILPWYRSKLVNITKTTIDYPKEKYLTRDGIYVEVDPAMTVRIVDPVKYEFKNVNPLQELGVLTKDVIRSFIAGKDAKELIGTNFSIEKKDPSRLFADFEERTGLHISHLFFKNVELPKELVDDYEKAKTQELENKRAIAEAKSKKEQAEINAQAERIKADAEAYREKVRLQATIEVLKEKGYEKEALEILKTSLIAGSKASIIANLGNGTGSMSDTAVNTAALLDALQKQSNTPEEEKEQEESKVKTKVKIKPAEKRYICPVCGTHLGTSKYCPNCQKEYL